MPNYAGRYDFGVMKQNFGGIQDETSLLSTPSNAASDILNFDLDQGGAISRRGGTEEIYDFGSELVYFERFQDEGTSYFFAITANSKFWSANDPAGPWTDRSGSVTWTNFTNSVIGASVAGKLVVANGYDDPILYVPNSNVVTLENASLETVASSKVQVAPTGTAASTINPYSLMGITPRGETITSASVYNGAYLVAPGSLTSSAYNTISWVTNNEFTAYKGLLKYAATTTVGATSYKQDLYYQFPAVGPAGNGYGHFGQTLDPYVNELLAPQCYSSGTIYNGTITMSGIAIANETFVIGTQTFTWKAARAVAGEVTIGTTAAEAVTNIVAAITADIPTQATAFDDAGDTVTVYAASALTFTEASTNMAVGGIGTLSSNAASVPLASTGAYLVVPVVDGIDQLPSFASSLSQLEQSLLYAAGNTVTWTNIANASGYKIIYYDIGAETRWGHGALTQYSYYLVDSVGAGVTSYTDNGGAVAGYTVTLTDSAYNTPSDWNVNGQPEGFAYVGKNREERMLAWRGNTVWASALSEPTNWFREGDAYAFTLLGNEDTAVTGISGLFDYTLIHSKTATFVYSGASANDITLTKVIPVGCSSHNSITYAGADTFWWSNYGPVNGSRVIQGADIAVNVKDVRAIQSLVFEGTNTSAWTKICGETDIVNSRIYWAVPKVAATTNNQTIVLDYSVKGFTRYEGFDFIASCVWNNDVYIASSDGSIYKMNSGNTDNGTAITAHYYTGHMDMGSYPMTKRMVWVDVLADRRDGNYSFDFDYVVDMGQIEGTAQTCTHTTTDAQTVETTSSTATEHRCYTTAMGNTFQLQFSTSAVTPLKLVAWRPEIRARGLRQ